MRPFSAKLPLHFINIIFDEPLKSHMLSPRVTYTFVLSGASTWCMGFILAPVVSHVFLHDNVLSEILYAFFRPVCHQMETRSLHMFGEPLAVCARCSAIYVTFLFGTVLYPFVREVGTPSLPSRAILLLSAMPMIIDALAGTFGLHVVTIESRLITGAIFGSTLPFFILPVIIEGVAPTPEEIPHHPLEKGLSDA